ncbi:MAG: ATP-binding cassette domain-containing protein [Treponema sp.]|nr:ATP-binding cassette domain-containing protein [Treponema sp.]
MTETRPEDSGPLPEAGPPAGRRLLVGIRDLSYSYGETGRPALNRISANIYRGEHTAILGANGSGKSTLLNCINGLCRPPPGAVSVYGPGGELYDSSRDDHLGRIRRIIGTVLQNPDDQIVSTVVESDTAFGPENMDLPPEEIRLRVDRALAAAGLEALRNRSPQFLSGGERQRLAIAGVLAMEGEALVLDEALSMLDPLAREPLLSLADTLAGNGKTVIQVTHSLEEAFRCSRCLVLDRGALVFDGKPADLLRLPSLEDWGFRLNEAAKTIRMITGKYPGVHITSFDPAETAAAVRAVKAASARAPSVSARPPCAPPRAGEAVSFDGVFHHYLEGTAFAAAGLDGADLHVPEGLSVALIGKSGSGKTTLLKHINALFLPSRGTVRVFGQDTADRKTDLRSLRLRAALAVQHPESALFETWAADDVAYGPRNAGLRGGGLVARVRDAMNEAGLPYDEYGERESRALSGGEKRRLALAGVLAMDSPVLLLDEPSASLDGKNRERVFALAGERRRRGKTVIVSTHSVEAAASFDLVAVMDRGRVAAFGPPRSVFGPQWKAGWGLLLPWTARVARELDAGGTAVPLTAEELAAFIEGNFEDNAASSVAAAGTEARPSCAPAEAVPSSASSSGKRRKTGIEFFRNMTFGQFLGRPSALRRLGAGKKLLLLLLLSALGIAGPHPLFPLSVLVLAIAAGAVFGNVEPKYLLRGFIPAFPYLLFLALLQMLFSWAGDTSPVIFSLGPVTVTGDELLRSCSLVCQLGALMTLLSLYTAVTPLRETLAAFDRALLPLSRAGIPVRDISVILGIALRFVPVLAGEAERIVTAQLSRGGRGGLKSAPGMIIPLFLRALERSETLAKAMALRLYHS